MKNFIKAVILTILFSNDSFAISESKAFCEMTSGLKQSLGVIGVNIANHETTRTMEGGIYVPKEIKCVNGKCHVIDSKISPMMVYKPGHLDANKDGYVSYPNIDLLLERTKFQLIAERLIALARNKKCGMHEGLSSNTFSAIYYSKIADQSDIFVKNTQGEIIIWQSMSNNSNGSILNLINGKGIPVPLPGDFK